MVADSSGRSSTWNSAALGGVSAGKTLRTLGVTTHTRRREFVKEDNRRWSWRFWMVLAVGAWLGAGLGVADTAAATTLKSGLLRSVSGNGTHCAVVNIGTQDIT